MDRIDKIKMFGKDEEEKKRMLEEQNLKENKDCIEKILALQPRIQKLIETANACINNGIRISSSSGNGKGETDFIAESFYHRVGFVYNPHRPEPIIYMGITAGGACGNLDFRTDGHDVVSIHQQYKNKSKPLTSHMEQFIDNIDKFEKRFYGYVDSIVN